MEPINDHIRFRGGLGIIIFECHHCGHSYRVNLPASTTIVVAIERAFKKDHKKCKQREKAGMT